MRKVIRKQVRRTTDGVRLAADITAAVSLNTGQDGQCSRTVVHSSTNVAQDDVPEPRDPSRADPTDPPPAKESP